MAEPAAETAPDSAVAAYFDCIDKSERAFEAWRVRAGKIEKIYTEARRGQTRSKRRYSMLWANVSTLKPVVYSQPPQPVVVRRFRDRDKVAKTAGEMVERAVSYTIDKTNFDSMMTQSRDDYLLVGRGTSWGRYEAETEPVIDPETGQQALDEQGQPAEKLASERVVFDYVHWRDFGHEIARTWEEVGKVWRKVYMDRQALVDRFGDKGKAVSLDHGPEKSDTSTDEKPNKRKATIYELWDKGAGKVVWLAKGSAEVLDERPPMFDLEGFFPCPRPIYATHTTDSLVPVPDYVFYQDQAEQIDDLTARIDKLTDSLKLVGFYPAGTEGTIAIQNAMKPSSEEVLVPVKGWTQFSERGGANQIQWVPIDTVAKTLQAAHENRQLLIQDIYQITGLSDIVRGESNPNETATAQNIKNQWGSIRVRERQKEIQRFARDCIRIMAEIVAEKFQAETLLQMTGMALPTQAEVEQQQMQAQQQAMMAQQAQMGHNGGPPMDGQQPEQAPQAQPQPMPEQNPEEPPVTIEAVMELLQNDKMRGYRIDVETDSTIQADEQADKESWNELLTAFSGMMQQAMPAAAQEPELVPVIGEMLKTTARKYRAGRSMEDVIEQAMENVQGKVKAMANQPPPEDPAIAKAKADIEINKQKADSEMQIAKVKSDNDIAIKNREMDLKMSMHQMDMQRLNSEHQARMAQMQNDHQMKQFGAYSDMAMKMRGQEQEAAMQQPEDDGNETAAVVEGAKLIAQEFAKVGEAIIAAVNKPRRTMLVTDPKTGRAIGSETVN